MARRRYTAETSRGWAFWGRLLAVWIASVLIASEAAHLLDPRSTWPLRIHILVGVGIALVLALALGRLFGVEVFGRRR